MAKEKKLYCSLDIETSGFDPATSDILEVGFAFFEITKKGLKITEEYTQVFKPTREVPANILGLTGIKKEELENAPSFGEHRDLIQNKLKTATIVGHNVIFDIKFLQSLGIVFSGAVIDTLDIVQFILPSYHSYNLENLMHAFEVDHKDAHRALADSKATIKLLEKMLRVYCGFSTELKEQIQTLIAPYDFSWKELLVVGFPALPTIQKYKVENKKYSDEAISLSSGHVYNFPLGVDLPTCLAESLSGQKKKILLVLPSQQQSAALWRAGLGHAVFSPEMVFDESNFLKLMSKKNQSADEVKFLLKVLVWRETNWQHECVLDLNLSFFGGQFKDSITGGKLKELEKPNLIITDIATFSLISKLGLYAQRFVLIAGLNEFEAAVSSNLNSKVSWGYVAYHLKSYFNPETGLGKIELKETVESALAATDLFFGLVNALLQTDPPSFQYYKITSGVEQSEKFQKIKQAATHYTAKLEEASKILKSNDLEKTSENLLSFFEERPNYVRWIELADKRCTFFSSPLKIGETVRGLIKPYKNLSFADALDSHKLVKYFQTRLELASFIVTQKTVAEPAGKKHQLDLFHKASSALSKKKAGKKIECRCLSKSLDHAGILELLNKDALPAAVLLASPLQVKEFYESNYRQLQEKAFLLSQNAAGSGSRMFRNFGIHDNSLLIATDKFVLKHLYGSGGVDRVEKLKVKTLIIGRLPFEQFTHPYQEALAAGFDNPFEDFSLPRALFNLHSLVKFFLTPDLEYIYLADAKLAKNYSTVFIDYLKQLPNIVLIQN